MSSSDGATEVANFKAELLGAETPLWNRKESEYVADCRVFKIRRDLCLCETRSEPQNFFCIEAPDWINVVPITRNGEVVMIEQFRHGVEGVTLEIPGGMVDEGEEPGAAAFRELLEETGFGNGRLLSLGKARPNPAIQNNWIHSFVVLDVERISSPILEGNEHTTVRLVRLEEIPALIANGTINHALVIVAFHKLILQRQGLLPS
jgi:8-oxo-dGTP pyrophosphatase MutT (NUDIX family)